MCKAVYNSIEFANIPSFIALISTSEKPRKCHGIKRFKMACKRFAANTGCV